MALQRLSLKDGPVWFWTGNRRLKIFSACPIRMMSRRGHVTLSGLILAHRSLAELIPTGRFPGQFNANVIPFNALHRLCFPQPLHPSHPPKFFPIRHCLLSVPFAMSVTVRASVVLIWPLVRSSVNEAASACLTFHVSAPAM